MVSIKVSVRTAIIIAIILSTELRGALSTASVWEVRSTSADTNGGGFVAGATGTDMSQFDNKNATACSSCQSSTVNISTTDAVANGTTTITSATGNFSAAIVGNIIRFNGGSGSITAVWKQVTAFTNSTTITIDSSIAASTGMTMNIGGALATIGQALTNFVTGNIVFVKATATYSITASLTLPNAANQTPTNTAPPNQVVGYTSSRTDAGRATIQLTTNSNLRGFDGTNSGGWYISNFVIDCNSLTGSQGVQSNTQSVFRNLLVKNCLATGVTFGQVSSRLIDSEITLNAGTAAVNSGNGSIVERCYIHDNTTIGVIMPGVGSSTEWSIIANNSGGSSDGINVNSSGLNLVANNSIYNNGRDGVLMANNAALGSNSTVRNNLLISNGRFGLNGFTSAGWGKFPQWDGNAYFGNASAARNNADDTGSTNAVNAANPYSNSLDVTLTGNPFTNAGAHDFTLNSTAGAGAAAKGTATPGTLPGLSQTGSMSFGALQPATSSTLSFHAAYVN